MTYKSTANVIFFVQCDSTCTTCVDLPNNCATCPDTTNYTLANGICKFNSCHANCKTCSAAGETKCLTCATGKNFLKASGQCLATCPVGTFAATQTCTPCNSMCGACTTSTTCTRCIDSTLNVGSNGCEKITNCAKHDGSKS